MLQVKTAMQLTKEDLVSLVFMYCKEGASNRSVADDFNEQHPERSFDHSAVRCIIERFTQTRSVLDRPRSVRPRSSTDDITARAVLGVLTNSPKKSTRKLSKETEVSRTSVRRILKQQHFHPYKVKLT
jgi:hypothetical protein